MLELDDEQLDRVLGRCAGLARAGDPEYARILFNRLLDGTIAECHHATEQRRRDAESAAAKEVRRRMERRGLPRFQPGKNLR